MRVIAAVLLILFFGFSAVPARAKSIEIRSDNFIISGDVRQKDAETLLRDLELFRKNVFLVLGVDGSPEIIPVKVFVAKNEKTFKTITGSGGFGGMYTMTLNGPAFVLNGKRGFRRGEAARHIALHEYSHHIVSTYTPTDYPLWYNEGFANYLAIFTYKDGTFRVGDPYDPYARALAQKNWMPMTVVLASMEKYPFNLGDTSKIGALTTAQFYAQTWLTTHYLRNEEKYAGKLTEYVSRLNKGERSIPAFKAAMGLTPDEFETELKAYYKKNRFTVARYTTTERDIPEFKTRSLNDKEAYIAKLEAMRSFVFTPERRGAVIKAYQDYEAKFGESIETLTAKADLTAYNAMNNEAYEEALKLIDKALNLDPENIDANAIGAVILVHQYGRGIGGSADNMKKARKYADKVLRHDSQIPLVNYAYALTYKDSYTPPENALNAAGYALDYYRYKGFMGSNLSLAHILANGEKYDEALPPIERAIIWAKDPNMRIAALGMRKYIEAEKAR